MLTRQKSIFNGARLLALYVWLKWADSGSKINDKKICKLATENRGFVASVTGDQKPKVGPLIGMPYPASEQPPNALA
jgi:hypothetical protein